MHGWVKRLGGLLAGARRDRDLDAEIASHLQLHIDDNVRSGMAPDQARRAALVKFGGVEAAKEAVRDQRGIPFVATLVQDVRYGLRLLRRHPGFAAVAVLSLALGIGANTAIFSVVDAVLLRPLPVHDPGRLVQLLPGSRGTGWTHPLWQQIEKAGSRFGGVLAWSPDQVDLARGGVASPARNLRVSAHFFDVLGVEPVLGRTFTDADDARGGSPGGPVAVISYQFWQRHFGGDPNVIGTVLSINRASFTIVGVTAASFTGPDLGTWFDVAEPIGASPLLDGRDRLDERTHWWLRVMARLAPGQTIDQARALLAGLQPALRAATMPENQRPEDRARYLQAPIQVLAASGGSTNVQRYYRQPLTALMVVVGLVLLVACANLANLLLARAEGRRHEVSLRLALGASRRRIVRQFLVESLLVATAGALAGLTLTVWGSRLLVSQLGTTTDPMQLELSVDWRVLLFTAVVTVAVALLFGTAPALRATRVDPHEALAEHGRGADRSGRGRVTAALVVLQVALCLMLVAGAGLFIRTFTTLVHRNPGFDMSRVLIVDVDARRSTRPAVDRPAIYDDLLARVRALPGVQAAALSAVTPLSDDEWDTLLRNPEGLSLPEADRAVHWNLVSPGWFDAYRIPFVEGRDFDRRDGPGAPPVAIVNEALARRFFPGRDPLGLTLREVSGSDDRTPGYTIVGVVRDALYDSLRDAPPPTMYVPVTPSPTLALTVRAATGSPTGLTRPIAAAVSGIDAGLTLSARPLAADVADLTLRERLLAGLSGFFGALALFLAGLGLYGVVSYAVGRRRAEIGIRMALGADAGRVVRLVVVRVALLVGAGIVAGGLAGAWIAPLAASMLYGLPPRDPVTFGGAALLLLALAVAAGWAPARRAARIDPACVLREG
jgi:putative ABC transport system permease protein